MKKKFTIAKIGLLPLMTVILFGAYFFSGSDLTPREKYEQFLVSEYKKVPMITEEENEEAGKPTRPDLAAIQDYFVTLDPELGRVPTERLKDAYDQTRSIQQQTSFKATSSDITWEGTGANMGGRTRAMMFDPNDPDHKKVWAGGVTGGLWYNNDITDEDSEWNTVDDFWESLSVSCIASDPVSPNVFYVGTGEVQTAFTTYRESSGVGVGIYKSANGGDFWQLLPSTEDFKYITDIVVRDEGGTSVIYAGVATGFYHGVTHQSEPSDGLYRSADGGATWEQVLPDMDGFDIPYAVSDIALGADGKMYVGTIQNVNGDGGATILMSNDGTPGSWTVFDDYRIIIENGTQYYLPGRVMLATAPSDDDIVYAIIGAGYNSGFNYYHGKFILKSENKGSTWEEINKPNSGDWATLAWHALTGSVNPANPYLLYVGGLDVWNTQNGGQSWNHVSDWALMYYGGGPDYIHADQHLQLYRPGTINEMIFASDGGVFYTADGANSDPIFEEHNKGFNTLQFYTCDISPLEGHDTYVGGLQDNGTLYYTGQPLDIDDMVSGGDGAYCFIDQNEASYMITSVYYNRYYVFYNGSMTNAISDYQSGIFINPADYDYKENVLYGNAVSFWQNNPNRILRIKNMTANANGSYVWLGTGINTWFSHVKYSPFSPDNTATLFLGTNAGQVFKVENAEGSSPTVTEITGNNFPLGSISCIAVGGSEDTLLVTFSNYGVSSIWQTFNGGLSWQEKEGNLPDMPVRWAIYHPDNSQQAMLATEIGTWTTNELHESTTNWYPSVDGMANVRVDMIKLRDIDNTVLAATHGRGLFTCTFPLDPFTSIGTNDALDVSFNAYPNPTHGNLTIELPGTEETYKVKLFDMSGSLINEWKAVNRETLSLNLFGYPKGNYLLTLYDGKTTLSEKIILK